MKTVVLINRGDSVGAQKILTGLKSKNNQEQSVIDLLLGIIAYDNNQLAPALKALQASEKNDPIAKFTLAKIGHILSLQKKRGQALTYLERANQLGYTSEEFLYDLAFVSSKTNNFEQSVATYESINEDLQDPVQILAYVSSLLRLDQEDKAIDVLDAGIELNKDNIGLYRKKVEILLSQGKDSEALGSYDSLGLLVDGDALVEVMIEQMVINANIGNIDEANALMQKINLQISNEPSINILYANRLFQRGLYDESLSFLDSVLATRPNNNGAIALKTKVLAGKVLRELRQGRDVQELVSQLNILAPKNNLVLWVSAIVALETEDDIDLALRYLQIKFPDITQDEVYTNYLAYLLLEKKSVETALANIENTQANAELSTLVLWKESLLRGNEESATTYYEQLESLTPGITEDILESKIVNSFDVYPLLEEYYGE